MKYTALLPLLVLIFSCGSDIHSQSVIKYYDIKSFTENLITHLTEKKPEVNKKWTYNKEQDQKTIYEVDWTKELKLFLDSDINKSSYLTSYDSTKTSSSIIYTLKPNENLLVKELSITFDSLSLTPQKIMSIKESQNYFFKNKTRSTMTLVNGELKTYSIDAVQKLLWFNPDSSFIEGQISL